VPRFSLSSKRGANVIAVDLHEGLLAQLMNDVKCLGSAEMRRDCDAFTLDVRKEEDMSEMARRTLEQYGRLDILVHCAGILRCAGTSPRPMAELSVTEWDEVLATNLKGTFLSNRLSSPR